LRVTRESAGHQSQVRDRVVGSQWARCVRLASSRHVGLETAQINAGLARWQWWKRLHTYYRPVRVAPLIIFRFFCIERIIGVIACTFVPARGLPGPRVTGSSEWRPTVHESRDGLGAFMRPDRSRKGLLDGGHERRSVSSCRRNETKRVSGGFSLTPPRGRRYPRWRILPEVPRTHLMNRK